MWCTASVKWWKIQRIQKVCSLKILFSWWVQIDQIEKFIILNLLFKLRDCSIAIWFFSDFLYIPSIQGWKYLSLWVAGCWLARLKWTEMSFSWTIRETESSPRKRSRFVPLRPGAAKSLYRRAGDFLLPSGSSRQEWREAEHNGLLIVRGLDNQPPKPDNFVSSVCNIRVSCMSIIEHIWTSIKVGYFAVQFSVKITYIKWLVDSVLKWSFDFYKDYCPFSMEQDSIFLEPFLNLLSEIIYR